MTRNRGHRNSNERGNVKERRARKQFLLDKFGDGTYARCSGFPASPCDNFVTIDTMYVDRIIPRREGGTYAHDNIQPHCRTCSCKQGANAKNRAAA